MVDENSLSYHQKRIIKAVVRGSIERVNYAHPSNDLGSTLEDEDIRNAMRGLEDRGVMKLASSGVIFKKNFYEVALEEAENLYYSLGLNKEK